MCIRDSSSSVAVDRVKTIVGDEAAKNLTFYEANVLERFRIAVIGEDPIARSVASRMWKDVYKRQTERSSGTPWRCRGPWAPRR